MRIAGTCLRVGLAVIFSLAAGPVRADRPADLRLEAEATCAVRKRW